MKTGGALSDSFGCTGCSECATMELGIGARSTASSWSGQPTWRYQRALALLGGAFRQQAGRFGRSVRTSWRMTLWRTDYKEIPRSRNRYRCRRAWDCAEAWTTDVLGWRGYFFVASALRSGRSSRSTGCSLLLQMLCQGSWNHNWIYKDPSSTAPQTSEISQDGSSSRPLTSLPPSWIPVTFSI